MTNKYDNGYESNRLSPVKEERIRENLIDLGKTGIFLGALFLSSILLAKGCVYWDKNIQPGWDRHCDEKIQELRQGPRSSDFYHSREIYRR
ncbi:Uncharacterised protein [uncultured archaeon]|nr:Uncharacterised protein [uncultured archaeon]